MISPMVQSNHMELALDPPSQARHHATMSWSERIRGIQVLLYIVLAEKHTYVYINRYNRLILHIIFTVMCAAQSPEFFRPEIQVSMIQVIRFLLVGNSQR